MIKKRNSSRYQFNLAMNEEEYGVLKKLKKEHSVNISGCFKKYLKEYLDKLEVSKDD